MPAAPDRSGRVHVLSCIVSIRTGGRPRDLQTSPPSRLINNYPPPGTGQNENSNKICAGFPPTPKSAVARRKPARLQPWDCFGGSPCFRHIPGHSGRFSWRFPDFSVLLFPYLEHSPAPSTVANCLNCSNPTPIRPRPLSAKMEPIFPNWLFFTHLRGQFSGRPGDSRC